MVIVSDNFIDTMKDFTALIIINEFDDVTGVFFQNFFINYDSFCKFRNPNPDTSDEDNITITIRAICLRSVGALWISTLIV